MPNYISPVEAVEIVFEQTQQDDFETEHYQFLANA